MDGLFLKKYKWWIHSISVIIVVLSVILAGVWPTNDIILNITTVTTLMILVTEFFWGATSLLNLFLYWIYKILSDSIEKIQIETRSKYRSWIFNEDFGEANVFFRRLDIKYTEEFPEDIETQIDRIENLKKVITERVTEEKELRHWLLFFKMKSSTFTEKYITPIFFSFGGISFVFVLIKNIYSVLRGLKENNTFYSKFLATYISFFVIVGVIIIIHAVRNGYSKNYQQNKVLTLTLEDILNDRKISENKKKPTNKIKGKKRK